ncbi:hypothetical protein MMC07_003264 [Pseudocyphellaria aurata]|nr:hypothetical protein [Pseudocyphellaria aurata]
MLLDTLLTDATTSEAAFHKYATTCTALLSAPLDVPEPASLSDFITTLLDKVVRSPSADTIRLIYDLFCGLTLDFLDTLPIDLLVRLQDQLIKILRIPDAEDHFASLICLAILAKLKSVESTIPLTRDISWPDCRSSPPDDDSSKSKSFLKPVDRYSSARQFFTVKRSAKTLDLVTLKVILACSRSCFLSVDKAIESLKLSEEIVGSIAKSEKRSWLSRNRTRTNKLFEKVLRQDIAAGVKYAAISFIATLMEGEVFPLELAPVVRGFLHASVSFIQVQKTIEKFVIQFDEPSIDELIHDLLELACSETIPSLNSLAKLENAIVLTSGLDVRMQDSSVLRQTTLHSLSTSELSELLHRFLNFESGIATVDLHEQLEACPHSYHQTKLNLHQRICKLFLKSTLLSSQDELSVDPLVVTALLDKQMSFSTLPSSCGFYTSNCLSSAISCATLPELEAAPIRRTGSRGWRTALCEKLSKDAESQHQSIVTLVGDICQDLELRCETFERPLREEESRANNLDEQLKASEAALLKLESRAQESISVVDGLEAEKIRLVEQLRVTEQRLQSLSDSYESLQQELIREQKEAADAAVNAEEKINRQDLAHLAIMIGKDEMYEERSLTLTTLEDRTKRLADELDQMRVQEEIDKARIKSLEITVYEKSEALETITGLAVSRQTEINCLVDLKADTMIEKEHLSSKLKESEEQCILLKAELDSRTTKFQVDTAELRRVHDQYIFTKAIEVVEEKKLYETTIHQLQESLSDADRSANSVAMVNEQACARLEEEISMLRRDQEQRANEFAQAQELSCRLMAVMGLDQPQAAPDNIQGSKVLQNSGNQGRHLPCNPDNTTPLTRSFRSSKSGTIKAFSKRPKTCQRFKSPTSHRAKVYSNTTKENATQDCTAKENRFPLTSLSDITQNVRMSTPSTPFSQERDQMQENDGARREDRNADCVDNPNDESFDDSDMFAGTHHHSLNSQYSKAASEPFDEKTVEF